MKPIIKIPSFYPNMIDFDNFWIDFDKQCNLMTL